MKKYHKQLQYNIIARYIPDLWTHILHTHFDAPSQSLRVKIKNIKWTSPPSELEPPLSLKTTLNSLSYLSLPLPPIPTTSLLQRPPTPSRVLPLPLSPPHSLALRRRVGSCFILFLLYLYMVFEPCFVKFLQYQLS